MAFYDKFPYTNFQELNLDWITQEVSKVRDNRDASDASAAAALSSEQAAKASETAAAASQQAAANSETAAAGSEAASAEYLAQLGTHTAGAVADWLKENLQPTTPPVDGTLSIAGAAADAKKTGDEITDLKNAINNCQKGKEKVTFTGQTGVYINSTTGKTGQVANYSAAKDSNGNFRIAIPKGCIRIDFLNIVVPTEGTAGWATYTDQTSSEDASFVRGGMSKHIDVQENDKYFGVSSAKDGTSFITSFDVLFVYTETADAPEELEELEDQVNKIGEVSETKLFNTIQGTYVNSQTGETGRVANYTIAKDDDNNVRIPIPSGCKRVIFNNIYNTIGVGVSGWATYSTNTGTEATAYVRGEQSKFFDVGENDKYFAVSSSKLNGSFITPISVTFVYDKLYGSNKLSNDEFNVVMLGDSIVGNYDGVGSIPYYLADYTGATCYNCAFGGSSLGSDLVDPDAFFEAFNGWKILTAIATDDWSEQQAAIDKYPSRATYQQTHLDTLKNMDWNKVDVITMSWGTNDWGTGVNLEDNQSDLKDTDTFGGAFRTGLEALWAVYPHIKIMCCGIIWRGLTIRGGVITGDSDDGKHGRQWYLREYEEKLGDLCKEYHVPFVPMYDYTNINKYTWSAYFASTEETHPNERGRHVIAKRYAAHLVELAKTI